MSGQTSRQRIVTLCVHFFNIDPKERGQYCERNILQNTILSSLLLSIS